MGSKVVIWSSLSMFNFCPCWLLKSEPHPLPFISLDTYEMSNDIARTFSWVLKYLCYDDDSKKACEKNHSK